MGRLHSLVDMAERYPAIRRAVIPLPGSQPRNHFEPLDIRGDCDGLTFLAALGRMVENVPAAGWQAEFARGRVVSWSQEPMLATQIVRVGQRHQHLFPNVTELEGNGAIEIVHDDEALIVVNKSAPLLMHAGGRIHCNTLQHILNSAYYPQQPRPAHRPDANTTDVVPAGRTRLRTGLVSSRRLGNLPTGAMEFGSEMPLSFNALPVPSQWYGANL